MFKNLSVMFKKKFSGLYRKGLFPKFLECPTTYFMNNEYIYLKNSTKKKYILNCMYIIIVFVFYLNWKFLVQNSVLYCPRIQHVCMLLDNHFRKMYETLKYCATTTQYRSTTFISGNKQNSVKVNFLYLFYYVMRLILR